ncbi:FAD:protein FMN transferase [Nocardioides sp.]|uniref:FAD:protein FMN transferase n=1 Tax=Nocardioides sp. TaxID=35761 RepID=UPI003D109975
MVAAVDWQVWSTQARLVVTRPEVLAEACAMVQDLLADIDVAASRFRPDSEICNLTQSRATLSPILADLLAVALDAAEHSGGAVDPTVGATLCDLGYDRDVAELDLDGSRAVVRVRRVPGWRALDLAGTRLTWPEGIELDLGATAKARAADLAASLVATSFDTGVLVSLGGDIASAGPAPAGDWQVAIRDGEDEPAAHIALPAGGAVATSSTLRRTWRRGQTRMHHVIDPATALPAEPVWRTVSVVGRTCVEANTASTATIVKGSGGRAWLAMRGLPARLVDTAGGVHLLGGWPAEDADREAS